MEEKKEAREIRVESKFLRWLENYWYHYKWHTIIVVFFALVLTVTLVQCASVEETDVTVAFGGNVILNDAEYNGLKTILGDVCPSDVDGNGEKTVAFKNVSIFNEKQLEDQFTYYYEELDEYRLDEDGMNLYKSTNLENYKNVQTYMMTGDCAVWFVSEYVYEEMFFDKVENQEKVRIVATQKLSETALYRNFDAVKILPEDTLVVLMRPIMGTYADDVRFAEAEAYYNAIVGENE